MGLTAYECVMTGVVGIAFHFDHCQIILKQVEIFLHEFLKYRFLIKIDPCTVGDIDYVSHRLLYPLLIYVREMATANAKAQYNIYLTEYPATVLSVILADW